MTVESRERVRQDAEPSELGLALAFRDAMAALAAPVTIVTTLEDDGRQRGFTASAVCSLSLEPPQILVSVARTSSCYRAFARADGFIVNVLTDAHRELAGRFATHGADRFAGGEFRSHTATGLPYLPGAGALIRCETRRRVEEGDHLLCVGLVKELTARQSLPLIWHQRRFGTVS